MNTPQLREELAKQVVHLKNAGHTFQEIGDMLGVSRQRAHQLARGKECRKQNTKIGDHAKAYMRALRESGKSVGTITKLCGVDRQTVRKYCKGIKVNFVEYKVTIEQMERFKKLRESGFSYAAISEICDTPTMTVFNTLKRAAKG